MHRDPKLPERIFYPLNGCASRLSLQPAAKAYSLIAANSEGRRPSPMIRSHVLRGCQHVPLGCGFERCAVAAGCYRDFRVQRIQPEVVTVPLSGRRARTAVADAVEAV